MKIEVENAQQNEKVDWSKNPQLVVNINCSRVVLVHREQSELLNSECFVGTELSEDKLSYFDNTWFKNCFKPFHGKITLSND